ncbi:MAG: F0F1 ATP synthase subunit B' [Pseudomonadota bacterium]
MPQFDPATLSPQVIWLVIVFAIFYFLMARLALPKIGEVLEEREERLADDLDQAEHLRREGAKAEDSFHSILAQARAEAMAIIKDARAKAHKELDEKSRALDLKLAQQTEVADAHIAAEKAKAMEALEGVATTVAQDIAARLLDTPVAAEDAAQAVKLELVARNGRA